ncbi:MAG: hypothetical protein ACYDAG_12225 [Chloroflexota bacterium]
MGLATARAVREPGHRAARLLGGIRNKAQRGELRRGLPVGFVWGEEDGEVRFDPDEAVTHAVRTVFQRFAELGSARRVWLWFLGEQVRFPHRRFQTADIDWATPTYTGIHTGRSVNAMNPEAGAACPS